MALQDRLSAVTRQIKRALTRHQSSIERGMDKAGDLVNEKTGAKHSHRIHKVVQQLRTWLGKITGTSR